jgi:capsular exopolysaccharide synthesis family protein
MMATMGGIAGGIFLAFGGVFLLGTIDRRAMSVRQLAEKNNALRVLGVMPDMDHVEQDSDLVNMAMNCIHRLRSKIETKRAPEKGYALMVSSPFQGDGKTTLTVSLGWSYAESGYRTLLIDTDFVGRAMTHQFGRLRESGLREVLRNGRVDGQLVELGHPNLSLLGVGFDRRVSAANLNPRLMSRVIDSFRDDFDIILVDTGPLTASLEFAPVAMACDGAVLTIRHGRSRARLTECIEEIRNVGSDYLGVVLNYANRGDCLRYGSSSKMSASAQQSLEELESAAGDENISSSMDSMFGKFASKSDGND